MADTLRLIFPQWQGGGLPLYHLGAQVLAWLAPEATGPVLKIDVPPPSGADLPIEGGIRARRAVLAQADAAMAALRQRQPARVVVLGGDCGVDLAPFAYLSERYGDDLAVLWIDAHPDIMDRTQTPNAHAMVLAQLLGEGDTEFVARVPRPLAPERVMYAGLYDMSPVERATLDRLGLGMATPDDLRAGSGKVLDWLTTMGAKHVAIHFDLDVLDPAQLRSLYFSRPDAAPGAFDGIPQGRMGIAEVVRLVTDVAAEAQVVGLSITEFLPWDAATIRDMLRKLPLLNEG
ncbi:MAG: arginase family protein [Rhodobacterales bacterium]|nr:arginase family protein [Rhodobacterales bacterium]